MALIKGVNSYVTVVDAESYFSDRLDVAAWTDADALQKPQALVTATAILDENNWGGQAVSSEQSLAFPRNITYFDPKLGMNVTISDTPSRILIATYELAYHFLNNDGLLDDTGSVDALTVASVDLKSIKSASRLPYFVRKLIAPLLATGGARMVWRAN
jgi:hypothetical protein